MGAFDSSSTKKKSSSDSSSYSPSSFPPMPKGGTYSSGSSGPDESVSSMGRSPSTMSAPVASPGSQAPSAFGGGPLSFMADVQKIEDGLQSLALNLPSVGPMCAQILTTLRTAIPDAVSAAAQPAGTPQGGAPGQPPASLPTGQAPAVSGPPPAM